MSLEIQEKEGEIRLFVSGEIDHHRTLSLRREMDAAIRRANVSRVILDLKNTSFCDSSALGLILGRVRVAQEEGMELFIRNPSARVRKILDLAGAEKFLKFA